MCLSLVFITMEPKVLLKTMIFGDFILGLSFQYRAVGRFENPGMRALCVEMGF